MFQIMRRVCGCGLFRRHALDETLLELGGFFARATSRIRPAGLGHFAAGDLAGGEGVHGERESETETETLDAGRWMLVVSRWTVWVVL